MYIYINIGFLRIYEAMKIFNNNVKTWQMKQRTVNKCLHVVYLKQKFPETIKLARKQMYITMNVSYTDKKNT